MFGHLTCKNSFFRVLFVPNVSETIRMCVGLWSGTASTYDWIWKERRSLISTTTTIPENGKRNNFPQTSRGQSERMKNIFNFLRFSHKYQKLIIRAASKQHEAEIWIPFAICLDMCHHIHLIKAPHLRSHDSINMYMKITDPFPRFVSYSKVEWNVWKRVSFDSFFSSFFLF